MIKLKRLKLKNYKIHKDFDAEFDSNFYELRRPNEFGKSTIFEAICDAFSFSVDRIKEKYTKGSDNLPVIIVNFSMDEEEYILTLNAQSDRILLEGKNGTYLQTTRSIADFFAQRGYRMFPFVVSQLLLIREKDISINTASPDLKKFTGDIFNVENINTLIKIISEKFLSERKPGLKKGGFGEVLSTTTHEIDTLKNEISDFEGKVREYNKDKEEYESILKEKTELEKDIHEKEELLKFLNVLKDVKRKEELVSEKEKHKEELARYIGEYTNLLNRKKQLSDRLKELENSKKELKNEIDKTLKLISEIKELEHEDENANNNLNRAEELRKELTELKKDMAFKEKELKTLEKTQEDLKKAGETLGSILKIYEEIEKLKNTLKFIKEKKDKLKDIENNLNALLKEEKAALKQLKDMEEEKKRLLKNIEELKSAENLVVLRERLLNVEEELAKIYSSLKDIERLEKEIESMKNEIIPEKGFTEDELKDALLKWQVLLEQKSSSKGEIEVIDGSVIINGSKKSKGETYVFEGRALIEKDALKLQVYTLLSLKQKEEELSKYIQHFSSIDNLKKTIKALETIREKEIRISSLEPHNLKKRYKELEKEHLSLTNKIKELEQQQKILEKLQKDLEDINAKYRKNETELNKIRGAISLVKTQKKEMEKELGMQKVSEVEESLKDKKALLEKKFRELGHDNPLAVDRVKEIYTQNTDKFNRIRAEIAGKRAEFDGIKRRITRLQNELESLSPDTLKERQITIKKRIAELKKELKDRDKLEKSLKSIEDSLKSTQKELEELSKNEGSFETTIKNLKEKLSEIEKAIEEIEVSEESLDNIPFGVVRKYITMNSEKLNKEIHNLNDSILSLRKKLTAVSEKAGILKTRLEYVPDTESLEQKRAKLLEYERKLERIQKMKRVLEFSKDVLVSLRENIEKEYLFRMVQETGRIFSHITDGRYHITNFNSSTLFIDSKKSDSFEKRWQVVDKNGTAYSFDELSDGTKTQLLLSIRLALVSLFFGKNTAFLMLDEPFAYFDSKREENTRKILNDLVRINWQILIASART